VPFNNLISRVDADVLIPEDQSAEILQSAIETSAAMALFPQVTMSTKTRRVPALSALPVAYFVNGDTGLKSTTEMAWTGQFLEAEEIAAIVPVPEAVLDDSDYDIWAQVRPRLAEAVGRTLDAAIFQGVGKPASWPQALIPAAIAAGNIYERGTNAATAGGIAADVSGLFSVVEADGYVVDGLVASGTYKGLLRNARDANGVLLSETAGGTIYGVPIRYQNRTLWPAAATAEAIAGDFSMGMLGIRQDLTYKLLDQAVITDDTGAVIFNLPQQDMLALRVVARFAWAVAKPFVYGQVGTEYPFAVMQNATP
jgi:HK97 family phage major capsid protein